MRAIFLLLMNLLIASPLAQAKELSEQEVLALFMQENLSLMAAKSQVDIAKAQVIIAKQLTNPIASLSVSGLGETHGWGSGYWNQPYNNNVSINQLIETAGKRQLRIDGAEKNAEAQKLLFIDLINSLKRDVLNAYYLVVQNQRRVVIYDEILKQFNEMLTANNLRWQAGDISETEFRRIELEAYKAKNDVEQSHLDLQSARQQLSEMLAHRIPASQLKLLDHFPARDLPLHTVKELTEIALDQRNDLHAAEITIAQQDSLLQLAEAQKVPDITIGAQYVHDPSAVTPDSAGLGIAMTLPLWHQYQGEVQQAREVKRSAEISLEQLRKQVQTQVSLAVSQFLQKKRILARFDNEVIQRAKQVRTSSTLAYRQGAISLLALLDAENNYRNTMLDYSQALYDENSAWLNLMYAMGQEGNQ